MNARGFRWLAACIVATGLVLAQRGISEETYEAFPPVIHPDQGYVIYSHGKIVEGGDSRPVHPDYGVYDFPAVKKALFDRAKFNLIAPHRPRDENGAIYVARLESWVRRLVAGGVVPSRIALVGFSRGAQLTAMAFSNLRDLGINTVLMAVCSDGDFTASPSVTLGGRLLSIYETTGALGSCERLATRSTLSSSEEIAISTGKAHGAFYLPRLEWIGPLMRWLAP